MTTHRGAPLVREQPNLANVTWSPAYESCGYEMYMPDPNPVVLPNGFKAGRNRAKPACCGPQYNMKPELPIQYVYNWVWLFACENVLARVPFSAIQCHSVILGTV